MTNRYGHQYVQRDTGRVIDEQFIGGWLTRILYADFPPGQCGVARLFSARWATRIGALAFFDRPATPVQVRNFATQLNVDLRELLEPIMMMETRTDLFVRRLRYETFRPLNDAAEQIVSPADCKLIVGKLSEDTVLRIKERFFDLGTLLGDGSLAERFRGGDFGVFRLAPEDYHYFHSPVSGLVTDVFEVEGRYYSVNPHALASVQQVLSANRRSVVLVDTEVNGGSKVGTVALVAIAAQVIGRIELAYNASGYRDPQPVKKGLMLTKGQPLGLFRPGSSTVVVLLEPKRIDWCPDLLEQRDRTDTNTRFTKNLFGRKLTEIQVAVRDTVAYRKGSMPEDRIPLAGDRLLIAGSRQNPGWRVRRASDK